MLIGLWIPLITTVWIINVYDTNCCNIDVYDTNCCIIDVYDTNCCIIDVYDTNCCIIDVYNTNCCIIDVYDKTVCIVDIYEIYIEQWPVPPVQAAKRVMSVANAKINVLHHLPKDTNQRKTFPWHCHELESEHEHPWDKFSKVFLKFVFCLNWPYKNVTVSTLCIILKTFLNAVYIFFHCFSVDKS